MGETRHDYFSVFHTYLPIACAVFAIVLVLTLAAVIFRRRRDGDDLPSQEPDHPRAELAYVVALVLIAAFLVVTTFSVEAKEDTISKSPALTVNVTAAQWSWRFDYPRYGITRVSNAAHMSVLTVPANTEIRFVMTSADVIHSFFIPSMRFKRDAIAGSNTRFDLRFPTTGLLNGACAEYCGLLHSNMLFEVNVLSPPAFRTWIAANRGSGAGT